MLAIKVWQPLRLITCLVPSFGLSPVHGVLSFGSWRWNVNTSRRSAGLAHLHCADEGLLSSQRCLAAARRR